MEEKDRRKKKTFNRFGFVLIRSFPFFFLCHRSINRLGGHGRIICVHTDASGTTTGLDVKYIIGGGFDTKVDPELVTPYQEPSSRGRNRRGTSAPKEVAPLSNSKADKENQNTEVKKRRSSKGPMKKKVELTQKVEPKRPLNFQILRPKKKVMKKTTKRESLDPTEALSDDVGNSQEELPEGIPREISFEAEQTNFFSPLHTHSKVDSIRNLQSPLPSPEGVPDNDSLGSVGEKNNKDYIQQSSKGVTTIVVSSKSPVSRTKPLYSGDLKQQDIPIPSTKKQNSNNKPQHPTKLERLQNTQLDVAKKFVNEVVLHTNEPDVPESEPKEDEREAHFRICLCYVLQMNGGYVCEDDLLGLINETSLERTKDIPLFQTDEARVYIESLVARDRIMQADGLIVELC